MDFTVKSLFIMLRLEYCGVLGAASFEERPKTESCLELSSPFPAFLELFELLVPEQLAFLYETFDVIFMIALQSLLKEILKGLMVNAIEGITCSGFIDEFFWILRHEHAEKSFNGLILGFLKLFRVALEQVVQFVFVIPLRGQLDDREAIVVSSGEDLNVWVLFAELSYVLFQTLPEAFVKIVLSLHDHGGVAKIKPFLIPQLLLSQEDVKTPPSWEPFDDCVQLLLQEEVALSF